MSDHKRLSPNWNRDPEPSRPPEPARTVQEVANEWHRRTGQRLTRSAVHLILKAAIAKVARRLESERP